MKQDFLNTIGSCKAHEYMCDESVSVEKIYDNVILRVSSCQKRKKALFFLVSGLAAAVAIFCVTLLSIKGEVGGSDSHIAHFQNGNDNSIEKKENAAIIFCVYEAKQREQIIMADYMEAMKKRELKTEKKIILGTYNPLSSTVPGYPVVISNSKKMDKEVRFSISASGGQLLQWNTKTGNIQELGKSGTFTGNEKLFWSPLNNEKLVKETKIKVNLFVKEQLADTIVVKIVMETEGTYTARRIGKGR